MAQHNKDKAPADPAQLFKELDALIQSGDHKRVVGACDRVLAALPADRDALRAKAVALVQLRRFEEALAAASLASPPLAFERAYCLYRLRRAQEALDALADAPKDERRAALLRAQVLFRLGRFSEAAAAYEALRPKSEPASSELLTNLSAAYHEAGMVAENEALLAECEKGADTYELVFNAACHRASQQRWTDALAAVERARSMMDADCTEGEAAPLHALAGYAHQRSGDALKAREAYASAQRAKGADADVAAVVESNAASLGGADGARHYAAKALETPEAEQRLSKAQRLVLLANRCLAHAASHHPDADAAEKALAAYEAAGGDADTAATLRAGVLARANRAAEGAELLEKRARASTGRPQLVLALTAAHLRATAGDAAGAARSLLSTLSAENLARPGVAHAAAAACDKAGDKDGAARALEGCTDVLSAAEALRRRGMPERAAKIVERAGSAASSSTDPCVIELLAMSDARAPAALAKKLPAIALGDADTADKLEARQLAPASAGARSEDAGKKKKKAAGLSVVHKKRNRPKKSRVPAAVAASGAQPDPERWLPKRERSSQKQRKGRRARAQAAAAEATAARSGAQGVQNAAEEAKYEAKHMSKAQLAAAAARSQEAARMKQLEDQGVTITAGRRRAAKKKHF